MLLQDVIVNTELGLIRTKSLGWYDHVFMIAAG